MNFGKAQFFSRHGLSMEPFWPKAKYVWGWGKGSNTNLRLSFKNMYKGFIFTNIFSSIKIIYRF